MQKISDSTNTANAAGEFTEGNPGAGVAATLLKASWFNALQRELVGLVLGANIALNASDDAQVLKAVKALAGAANDFLTMKNKPSTLDGYGISDALAIGQYGLGTTKAPAMGVDTVGLPSGFYYFGGGGTTFANNVGLVNIPYADSTYAGQIGFQQGNNEPRILVRGCKTANTWTPTRELWHSGTFDPSSKADKATTLAGYGITNAYTTQQIDTEFSKRAPLISPVFTGTPSGPTAPAGTATTQFATTAFVTGLGSGKLSIGQYGLGGTTAPAVGVDTVGLPGGFYYFGGGPSAFGNNVGLVNIPYGADTYAGQIGFVQGNTEPLILVRGCKGASTWTATRSLWHSGNLDPNLIFPTGTTIQFAGAFAPSGFLKENGAAVSRTTYANLFNVIGTNYGAGDGSTTFNLPDSRGEFIRGVDDGRGVDPGRAMFTWQDSDNKAHSHLFGATHNNSFGLSATGIAGVSPGQVQYATASSGGSEARSRNVVRVMCIKY